MGGLLGQNIQQVLPYIMGGILCFQLGGYIVQGAAEVYVANGGVIRNHAYPYTYYLFENIANNVMLFLHNVVVYYIFVAAVGALSVPNWTIIIGFPLVLISMFTWGTMIGLLAARFRDLRFMVPFVGNLLFYLTPIMWRPEQMHGYKKYVALLNPFYGLVEVIRAPLMGNVPPAAAWELAIATAAVGILVWLIFFPIFRRRIPFWV
jgi:ABC-2 type transport system permease protein/lipopolysaccharide transport system permease protein